MLGVGFFMHRSYQITSTFTTIRCCSQQAGLWQ